MAQSSTYAGVRRLAQTRRDCRFYALETAPHYRRYIGALDVACAAVRARFDPRPCGPGVLEAPASMASRVPREYVIPWRRGRHATHVAVVSSRR